MRLKKKMSPEEHSLLFGESVNELLKAEIHIESAPTGGLRGM